MPFRLSLAALLLLGFGCSDRAAEPPAPEAVADAEAAPVRPGLSLDELLSVHDDDAPVLARLRPPRTVGAEAEPNRHVEGQVDTVRTYVYDGMTIEAYEVTDGPTFIQRITVTGGDYRTASGLAVGAPRADVEAVLGDPAREVGPEVVYETGDAATPTTVSVAYELDEQGRPRATQITWAPYVD